MVSSFKKFKRYLSDSDWETESDFLIFIIIESLQDIELDQLSPFLIEKKSFSKSNPQTVKRLRTENLLVEVERKNHAENLQKMEKFHNLKCRAYPHAKLNTSKGVVRSKEQSPETPEKIETAFKKQGMKEYIRVTICRNDVFISCNDSMINMGKSLSGSETIQTHT